VPVVLILVARSFAAPDVAAALQVVAGLSAFATGWCFKFILVRRAAYNQGFALTRTPVRGAGVAGPAVKPGWTMP
jgi:phenylacetyl-CoA:acceptor oxidoreductase subunit 2